MLYMKTVCTSGHNRLHLVNYTFTAWYGDTHTHRVHIYRWPEWCSRYIDLLWAGQSAVLTPVGVRFFPTHPDQHRGSPSLLHNEYQVKELGC